MKATFVVPMEISACVWVLLLCTKIGPPRLAWPFCFLTKQNNQTERCFLELTGGKGGVMGLEGLKVAVRIGGIKGEAAGDTALKQVLQKHASASSSGGQVHSLHTTRMF